MLFASLRSGNVVVEIDDGDDECAGRARPFRQLEIHSNDRFSAHTQSRDLFDRKEGIVFIPDLVL